MQNSVKLSDLQISVLKVFWKHGKLSVSEAHQWLNREKTLAVTTVATVLKRMQEKGIVDFEKKGRQHVYYPLVTEKDVKTSMLSRVLSNLFDGEPAELVHHLVAQDDVQASDLAKIRRLLAENQREPEENNDD